MKKNIIKKLASCAIFLFFIVMAFGSADSSNTDSYDYNQEAPEIIPEPEPDFSIDINNETVEAVEIEPDFFNDDEDEISSSGYVESAEIDTTFVVEEDLEFE